MRLQIVRFLETFRRALSVFVIVIAIHFDNNNNNNNNNNNDINTFLYGAFTKLNAPYSYLQKENKITIPI